jgi:integrase
MHAAELNQGRKGFLDPKQNKVATTHGFRSTFRDWAAEQTNYPREACEHALAHKLPDSVEAAYLRSDFLAKRARLMADWACYCSIPKSQGADNVIPIGRSAA